MRNVIELQIQIVVAFVLAVVFAAAQEAPKYAEPKYAAKPSYEEKVLKICGSVSVTNQGNLSERKFIS